MEKLFIILHHEGLLVIHVTFSLNPAGDRSCIYKGRCQSLAIAMALSAAAPGKGGVLDRPVEKTTPGRQSEFDVK